MQAVHELGHVLGAAATGGRVERVVLHPLTISETDVLPNPRPLIVVWAGPLVGVLLPLALLIVFKLGTMPLGYLVQFFAGFCLIANGAYIGGGSFYGGDNGSDPGVMLDRGSPIGWLWLFGAVTLPLGLYLWNGLGPHFGRGPAAGKVEHRAAYVSCFLLALTTVLELAFSSGPSSRFRWRTLCTVEPRCDRHRSQTPFLSRGDAIALDVRRRSAMPRPKLAGVSAKTRAVQKESSLRRDRHLPIHGPLAFIDHLAQISQGIRIRATYRAWGPNVEGNLSRCSPRSNRASTRHLPAPTAGGRGMTASTGNGLGLTART